ncbi:MAG: hypothetical protein IJ228_09230 [Succinivibrio sp.]|nr:hypothetical protein [Succinivibrio sp.]
MATFAPKAAFGAIHKHYSAISRACVEEGGLLLNTPDNTQVIRDLLAQRVVTAYDDELGLRIHGKIRDTVNYFEGHFRFKERHGAVQGLIDDLDNYFGMCKRALNSGQNARTLEAAISRVRDAVLEIGEMLEEIIGSYRRLVSDDFGLAGDIDEKIRQTMRCRDELQRINEIFSQLTVDKLQERYPTQLPQLRRLFFVVFSGYVARGLSDFNDINSKLLDRLDKLNRDKLAQRRGTLLELFARHYHDNPTYVPVLRGPLPPQLCRAAALRLNHIPNLSADESTLEQYAQIAQSLGSSRGKKIKTPPPKLESIEDVRQSKVSLDDDEIALKLDYFFQALLPGQPITQLSASAGYRLLAVNIPYEDWLFLVLVRYYTIKDEVDRCCLLEEVCREVSSVLTGNIFLEDLIFTRRTLETAT